MNETTVPTWTIADRLRKAREHAGLEQIELADRMGVGRNTVGNYERGLRDPKHYIVRAWAAETGVPLEWLLEGESRARRDSNPQPSDLYSAAALAVAA